MSGYGFRGYGLTILSDIDLPEYVPESAASAPDIRIRLAPGSLERWKAAAGLDGLFVPAPEGGYLMWVRDVAIYHVRDGREISIAVEPGADPGALRLFTVGSAMGMALHQRGVLVLHGATVSRGGVAQIFVGESGEGKSTLAAHLGRKGCTVLGDDTMALWSGPAGGSGPWLWQGSRVFKLWEDSIAAMGLGVEGLDRLGNRTNKFYMPNPDAGAGAPGAIGDGVPLAEVLLLEVGDGPARIEPLQGLLALRVVSENTYRPEYVPLLGREAEHFKQCGDLARDVSVSRLVRPWGMDSIETTIDLLLRHWDGAVAIRGAG